MDVSSTALLALLAGLVGVVRAIHMLGRTASVVNTVGAWDPLEPGAEAKASGRVYVP